MKQKPYFELATKVPFIWLLCLIVTNTAFGQNTKTELPKEKQTTLGLYVTSAEAYEKWKADPEKSEDPGCTHTGRIYVYRSCRDGHGIFLYFSRPILGCGEKDILA